MRLSRVPAALLASLLLAVAPQVLRAQSPRPEPVGLRPDAPTYAKHGPHWVGTRELVIPDAAGGRSLPATLWYPALNPAGLKEANTFTHYDAYTKQTLAIAGRALVDAPPDRGKAPYPLMIFSHGDDSSRMLHVFFQEHLASHGFAVLGIDHPWGDEQRPGDLVRTLDFAEELSAGSGDFKGMVDAHRAAVVGQSQGALAVLRVAGACYGGRGLLDPRIQAVVPMSLSHEPESFDLREARTPTLLLVGSLDSRAKQRSAVVYQALPAERKAMVSIIGGTHGSPFMDAPVVLRPGTLDLLRAEDLVNHFITAFLLDVLKGDPEARKALLPEAVTFEEIQYTTTWR